MSYAPSKLKYNKREKEVQEAVIEMGWKVLYKGWPDFLCYKEDLEGKIDACFVEVKKEPMMRKKRKPLTSFDRQSLSYDMKLTPEQKEMHRVLKQLGFEVKTIYKD